MTHVFYVSHPGAETGKAAKLGMYNHDPVKVFEQLDVSDDGALSKEEFATAMRKIGLPFKPSQVKELLNAFDIDKDGNISKDEFVKMATELLNVNKEKAGSRNKKTSVTPSAGSRKKRAKTKERKEPRVLTKRQRVLIRQVLSKMKTKRDIFGNASVKTGHGTYSFDARKVFASIQRQRAHELSHDEFVAGMQTIGLGINETQVRQLAEAVDEDENGSISEGEFCAIFDEVNYLMSQQRDQEMEQRRQHQQQEHQHQQQRRQNRVFQHPGYSQSNFQQISGFSYKDQGLPPSHDQYEYQQHLQPPPQHLYNNNTDELSLRGSFGPRPVLSPPLQASPAPTVNRGSFDQRSSFDSYQHQPHSLNGEQSDYFGHRVHEQQRQQQQQQQQRRQQLGDQQHLLIPSPPENRARVPNVSPIRAGRKTHIAQQHEPDDRHLVDALTHILMGQRLQAFEIMPEPSFANLARDSFTNLGDHGKLGADAFCRAFANLGAFIPKDMAGAIFAAFGERSVLTEAGYFGLLSRVLGGIDLSVHRPSRANREHEEESRIQNLARPVKKKEIEKEAKEKRWLAKKKKVRAAKRTLKKVSDFLIQYLKTNMSRALDVFRMMDYDRTGTLTREEFFRGLYELGLEGITREDSASLAAALDRNGDGRVQYEELRRLLQVAQKRATKHAQPPPQRVGGYGYTADY